MVTDKKNKTIIIATGASGGHIFPALAVAEELSSKGYNCVFVGNGKGFKHVITDAGYRFIDLPASPWNVRNPLRKMLAVFNLIRAFIRAFKVVHQERASAVFGTGGYATVATMIAGRLSGIPTCIQEQNVLPGRANRMLAKWVDKVCLSFDASRHYLKYRSNIMVLCGNPLRKQVLDVMSAKRGKGGKFNLLIMGGSQGARILSDVLPEAVALLKKDQKKKISIVQQARHEDVKRVQDNYAEIGVKAEVASFFDDIPKRMVESNLVISRSGASTVTECAALGRAAVFVPLRLADGHQLHNARVLENKEAAVVLEQTYFTPEKLSQIIADLMVDKTRLSQMEENALSLAMPDAAANVAAEVMQLAEQDVMHLAQEVVQDGN